VINGIKLCAVLNMIANAEPMFLKSYIQSRIGEKAAVRFQGAIDLGSVHNS
jgi:hypothetical protein